MFKTGYSGKLIRIGLMFWKYYESDAVDNMAHQCPNDKGDFASASVLGHSRGIPMTVNATEWFSLVS